MNPHTWTVSLDRDVVSISGNLVLYGASDGRPLWASDTCGENDVDRVVMQVLRVWRTSRCQLTPCGPQDDGNFCMYDRYDCAIWSTRTDVRALICV